MNTIAYAVDLDTGLTYSRRGKSVAVPVLQYDAMGPDNNFATSYALESAPVSSLSRRCWNGLHWTKRLPIAVKNAHRAFWGMALLRGKGEGG